MNDKSKLIIFIFLIVVNGLLLFSSSRPFRTTLKNEPLISTRDSLENYYERAKVLGNQQASVATTTFLAVGDIMLSRNVAQAIVDSGNLDLPYSQMSEILKSTDFNFGNLESPFYPPPKPCGTAGGMGIVGGHSLVFGAPCDNIHGLRNYNFKILNLANNHALDQGLRGLEFTKNLLGEEIRSVGAGKNLEEAWQPAVVEPNGFKICFVGASYASINDNGKLTNNYVARMEDSVNLKLAVQTSKSLCDFTVVTMHGGTEYVQNPNELQVDFARAAIDFGADMVVGAHPHWVQTIEKYQGKYIFYSLGNFIFDQMWSLETREGLALKINLSKPKNSSLQGSKTFANLDSIELIPVIIENYSTPRPANEQESKNILKKIGQEEKILK